jgi:cyclophilin family peptidyl-prolyl cis-trans isomerase
VSKKTHNKQVRRARAKRQAASMARKQRRVRIIAVAVIIGMAALAFGAALAFRDPGDPTVEPIDASPTDAPTEQAPTEDAAYSEAPTDVLAEGVDYHATVETTMGSIEIDLDEEGAPTTVGNFVFLANEGYYEGVIFHRVIEDFMIQGGDPTGTGTGGPGYTFDDELGPAEALVEAEGGYPRGTLAMANSGPNTNGSQFFVVQGQPAEDGGERQPYPLPPAYAVFGQVTDGMQVVDEIAAQPVTGDRPDEPVAIVSVTIDERDS